MNRALFAAGALMAAIVATPALAVDYVADGYQVLRIRWKDMYHDSKTWIDKAYRFIHGANQERKIHVPYY